MLHSIRRVFLFYLLTAGTAFAQSAPPLAQHLLELSGRRAGICSIPRCDNGKLAVELSQNSKLLVHAMSTRTAEVDAVRKTADDAGLLGRTVYVEEGSVAQNPLADWCADVLMITNASDADLDQIPQKDVRRVLSPYRGVAVVGRSKTLGAGLTRAKLETWLKALEVPGGKIVEDDFGLWAVVTMPPLAGGDDWGHYAHGADQNRASKDDTLKWPYLMQWAAKPYYDGKFDIAVAAGGRLFRANATLALDNGKGTDGIIARSAYNGNVLWKRKTADDFGTFGSLIVATPDVVYVKDGNSVQCLDAETGAELKRIALSNDTQTECKWLMLENGVLVTVLGPCPDRKSLRDLPESLTKDKWNKPDGYPMNSPQEFDVHQQWFQKYDQGREIVATDVSSGKELWRLPAPGIDPAKTAIATNRVFYYAERAYASCLDLKTGKVLWKTDAPIEKNPKGAGWSFTFLITQRVAALASPEVYIINSYKDGHYQAFAAKDGKHLWGEGHGRVDQKAPGENLLGAMGYPVLMDGKILDKGGVFLDPLTGKQIGDKLPSLSWGTCGSICISPHGLHGGGGTAYNLDTKTAIDVPYYMKSACLSGVIPADGILFSGHGACEGCMEWLGHLAFCPAGGISLNTAPTTAAARLVVSPVMEKSKNTSSTPLDWTTYRANNSRSGSSAATVPPSGHIIWTWTPNPPFSISVEDIREGLETQSTQAICIGDQVIFGTATGVIRSLDRKTGGELWNYTTAGRIISPPTFWEGKIYAGSGDGHVYCLSADSGLLLWRYRVAPIERRIMVFSHLMSSWPVNANVLVQPLTGAGQSGAAVYASAGLIGPTGGSLLCALDARTGKPFWETRFTAESGMLPSATGQMAWNNGKLWWHAGDSGVLIIDPSNGKASPAIDFEKLDNRKSMTAAHIQHATCGHTRGQDIGIISSDWIVLGGKQFYLPVSTLAQPRNTSVFFNSKPDAASTDSSAYPNILELTGAHGTDAIPVWDAKETLLFGNRTQRPVLCSSLTDALAAKMTEHPFDPVAAAKNYWNGGLLNVITTALPSAQVHAVLPADMKIHGFVTPVLAGNAIIFLNGWHGEPKNWHVVAVSREDSKLLWDIALPLQPVPGALSLTSAGDVLVPLVDGRIVCIGNP